MRILFLVGHPPWPLTQGRSLRNFHILKRLARSHELHVLCGHHGDLPESWPAKVESLWESLRSASLPRRSRAQRILGLIGGRPDLWQAHWSEDLLSAGREILDRHGPFDRIHVAGFEMYEYAALLNAKLQRPASVVLDEHNIEYRLQESLGNRQKGFTWNPVYASFNAMQTRRLRRAEVQAWRDSAHVLAVSQRDRHEVLRVEAPEKVTLLPNGIDWTECDASASQPPRPFQLSFIGKMDYRPNILAMQWFCRRVMPSLERQQPQVRLNIVGRNPVPAVLALGSSEHVRVTGFVENLDPYYAPGSVAVLPIFHGGGTRLKVFEALQKGVPIVSTRLGVSGIGLTRDRHCLMAETPEEFAEAILSLWRGDKDGKLLVKEGRSHIRKNFDWSALLDSLDRAYR